MITLASKMRKFDFNESQTPFVNGINVEKKEFNIMRDFICQMPQISVLKNNCFVWHLIEEICHEIMVKHLCIILCIILCTIMHR